MRNAGPPGLGSDESFPDTTPPWAGPPPFEVGVPLPVSGVMCRNDRAALVLLSVVAHSEGVVLSFRTIDRQGGRARSFPHEDWDTPLERTWPDRRLAAEFADGRFAVDPNPDLAWDLWTRPPSPVLTVAGAEGSGDDDLWVEDERLWLWPLPPPGPLTLAATSQRAGLDGRTEIDGAALLAAAARAAMVWPEH